MFSLVALSLSRHLSLSLSSFFSFSLLLFSFSICYGHHIGGSLTIDEQDPLPSEDVSVNDENISHISHPVNSEFITISVTDERGEKGQLPNG